MLKRQVAPITQKAWDEIDERAKDVLKTYLSARKVVKVNGPKGLNYTVVSKGRLGQINKAQDVSFGLYDVKPLTEMRVEFELDRWELDNIERGAKDIELGPLEEAVKKAALFEENAIYNGIKEAMISGLVADSNQEVIEFGQDVPEMMNAISEGILRLKQAYATSPYILVVGESIWKRLNKEVNGYPLMKRVESLLESKVVYSHVLDGALLLPFNHEDLEMTIGCDYSIGYQSSDNDKVKFFISESFTYRTLDPAIIIKFKA